MFALALAYVNSITPSIQRSLYPCQKDSTIVVRSGAFRLEDVNWNCYLLLALNSF
jgi:hypothetical protein